MGSECAGAPWACPARRAPPGPTNPRPMFARHQLAKLVMFMAADLPAEACAAALE